MSITAGGPPTPARLHPTDQALEALALTREHALYTRQCMERLEDYFTRHDRPASLSSLTLTSTKIRDTDRARHPSRSFGIYNPTGIHVYIGIAGNTATATGGIAVPPKSLVVFPVATDDIDVGVDVGDVLAGDATVWILRFQTVQPASMGAIT